MPFVEYTSKRKAMPTEANYIRISSLAIRFSEETFELMGRPKAVKVYYDETSRRIAMKASEDGSGLTVQERKGVFELFARGFFNNFKIVIDNPLNCKLVKEGSLFICALCDGIKTL